MADIKLIATDLDGTFMADFNTPHPENIRMLKKCKQRGIAFCLCTGRNWSGVRDLVADIPFDRFCVINNGASIYDSETNTLRYRNRFAPETAEQILSILSEYENPRICVCTTDTNHILEDHMNDAMRARWNKHMEENPKHAESFITYGSMDELIRACQDDIQCLRVGIDIATPGILEKVYKRIRAITDVEITSGAVGNMEITAKDGTKAEALTVLADIFGAKPQNVLALGDSYNDIHMLLWAGTGVAMGNADIRLKCVADYVTDTNVNAGVAKAIDRIVFGGSGD